MADQADISQRISQAKQAGYSDSDIYSTLSNDAGFQKRITMAKKEGFTDEQIAGQLGLKVGNSQGQHLASDGYGDVVVDGAEQDSPEVLPERAPIVINASHGGRGKQQDVAPKPEAPSLLVKIGHGAEQALGGLAQGYHWLGDKLQKPLNDYFGTHFDTNEYRKVTNQMKEADALYQKGRAANGDTGTDWGSLSGEVLAGAPLGLGGMGRSLLGAAVRGAVGGAAIGAAQTADNTDQRLGNTALGAIGGAVGGAGAKFAGDNIVRGVNTLHGNLKTGAQDILDEGAKHGVRVSANDAGQGAFGKKSETLMENIPVVGMSGFREAQQQEAKAAAGKVTSALQKQMSDAEYKSIDKLQQAASSGDKNAIRIMDIVNHAGDDTGKVLQAAAEVKNWRGQQLASQMYDKVGALAGDSPVTPTNTIQAIDNVISSDSKVIPNKELLNEIQSIREKLTDPSINTNFSEMRAARSRLGELVDEWGKQQKSTSGLTKIRSAIDSDLAEFAKNSGNPELYSQYKRADSFYRDLQSGKDKALANAMRSQTPDEIYNQFIKSGKGDRASNFYQNLDPKGQAALRYGMANQALSKATNESTGVFSPAKFALEFERMSEPYSRIFNGTDKAQMDGFVKLMRHVERAGQYAENPPNGNRLVGVVMGGAAATNLPLAIKAAGASAIAKALFTTNAGKRILLASKDLPPNSPKLANLMKQAEKLASTVGADSATQ